MKDSVNNEAETPAVPEEAPAHAATSAQEGNSAVASGPQSVPPIDSPASAHPVPVVMQRQPAAAAPATVNTPPAQAPATSNPAPVSQPAAQPAPVSEPQTPAAQPSQPAPQAQAAPTAEQAPVPATAAPAPTQTPAADTLANDAILASPTPVDSDPPPLVDVPPLSAIAPASGGPTTLAVEPGSHLPPPRPQASSPVQAAAPPQTEPTPQPAVAQPAPAAETPSPQVQTQLASEPQPTPAAQPVSQAQPAPAAQPISEPQPASEAQPAVEAQPVSEPQPVVELPPVEERLPAANPPRPETQSAAEPPPKPMPAPEATAEPKLAEIKPPSQPEPYAETGPELAAKKEAPGEPAKENQPKVEPLPELTPLSMKPLPASAAEGLTLGRDEMEIPLPESDGSDPAKKEEPSVEASAGTDKTEDSPPAAVPSKEDPPVDGKEPTLPILLTPTAGNSAPDSKENADSKSDDSAKTTQAKSAPAPKKADSVDDIIQELTSKTTLKAPTKRAPRKKVESKLENYVKNEFFVSEGAEDPWILPAAAAAGVAANHKRKATGESGKAGAWGMFTSIFFFGSIFVLGGLALTWMMRGTIAAKIEEKANRKVEEAGYFIDYSEWEYDPVRGIVLKNVTVFESETKTSPYAKIDNIGLNADFLAILRTREIAGLKKTISFRDSNLTLFDQDEVVANLSRLRGALELSPGLLDMDSLKGRIEGVRFDVGGTIRFPESEPAEVSHWQTRPEPSSLPTSEPGTNSSGSVIIQDDMEVELDPTSGNSKPSKSELLRPSFAPRDDIGAPRAIPVLPSESSDPGKSEAPAPEEPTPLVPETTAPPAAVTEEPVPQPEPPAISSPPISPPPIAPPPIAPPPIDPIIDPGTNEAAKEDDPSVPSSEPLASESGNRELKGLPSLAFLRDLIPLFQVKSEGPSPVFTSRFEVDRNPGREKLQADGRLTGSQITFRNSALEGIPFHSIDLPYSYDHSGPILTLQEFSIGHEEGTVSGNIGIDLARKLLNLQSVRSSIDLFAFFTKLKPDLEESLRSFRFLDAPEIFIPQGQLPWEEPMAGQFNFTYEQWAGLVWTIGGKQLPVREIRGAGKLSNSLISLDSLHAKVLDGPTYVEGSLRLAKPDYPFNGSIKVRAMPVASLAKFAGVEGKYLNGLLNLDYQGSITSTLAKMGGTGAVELKDGQLYKVPVIGPIQRLLGSAIPVFGPKDDSALTGNFIVDSGILMTSDLLVRSDGTRIAVKGQADLTQLMTDFTATANLDGPLGVATGLTGEKIEIEGRGPLKNPVIRLKGGALPAGFSSETVKGILGIADGSNEAMSAMMQEIAAGSGGAIGTLLKGLGGEGNRAKSGTEAATEVLRGVVIPAATPVEPVPTKGNPPPRSGASAILESVRKSQEGLQGILQKTR